MRINTQLLLYSTLLMILTGCGGSAANPNSASSAGPTTREIIKPQLSQPSAKPAPAPVVEAVPPPVTRPAVVTLRFNASSIDAITAGTKTSTCRKGVREFPGNVAIGTDGKRNVNLVILTVVTKKFSELSAEDAKSDGSEDLDGFKGSIKKSYPEITDSDVVTVVSFHVAQ